MLRITARPYNHFTPAETAEDPGLLIEPEKKAEWISFFKNLSRDRTYNNPPGPEEVEEVALEIATDIQQASIHTFQKC